MKREFIITRQGKEAVLYAGLLAEAHEQGLKRISTKLIQIPTQDNGQVAICWAEVETSKGIFSGIGDASPGNVGKMIVAHTIRMSETRAKARALRDAVNVGVLAADELGDDEEPAPARQTVQHHSANMPATPALRTQLEIVMEMLDIDRRLIPADITEQACQKKIGELKARAQSQATEEQWKTYLDAIQALHQRTGEVHDVPDSMTQAEYHRLLKVLNDRLTRIPQAVPA